MVTKPYIEFHIDFDEDGVFESGEDITSDVRYWSVQRGKDPAQHRAFASTLRLELNNFDHKYSPSNTSSALYPFTLPGPLVRVRMGYPADTFDGDDSDALNGRTPDLAGSELGTWTATTGMTVQSNKIEINSTGTFIATLDYSEPNVRLAARVKRPDTATNPHKHPLFVFRYVDSSNYAYVAFEGTSGTNPVFFRLHEVIAGVDNTRDTESAPGTGTWDEGDEVEMEVKVSGDTVEIYGWGDQAFSAQLTGLTELTGTRHGIGGPGFTTDSEDGGVTWDDFGLLVKFYGRVDAIDPQTAHEDKLAYIRAFDDMERMRGFGLYTSTPTPPATAGEIAVRILSRAEFDRGYLVDDGTSLTPAAEDSSQETVKVISGSALEELEQVAADEVGFFYLDAAGVAHFEAADHRENNDHAAPIATWGDNSTYDKKWLGPLVWDDGIEGVENQIFYYYYRQSKTSSQTVWELQDGDDPPFDFTNRVHVNDSSLGQIDIVTVGNGDGLVAPRVLIPGTDYTINAEADGSGVNWLTPIASETGTVSMTVLDGIALQIDDTGQDFQSASVSLGGLNYSALSKFIVIVDASGNRAVAKTGATDPDGDGTRLNLVNNPLGLAEPAFIASDDDFDHTDTPLTYDVVLGIGYPLGGYEGNYQFLRFLMPNTITLPGSTDTSAFVTAAQLVADKTELSDPSIARAEDLDSINTYGQRRVQHETKHIADWITAVARAEKRLEQRKESRERVQVRMQSATALNLMEILYREVSDRIRIVYDDMGIDRDHFIENYLMEAHADWGGLIKMKWEMTRVVVGGGLNYVFDDDISVFDTAVFAAP